MKNLLRFRGFPATANIADINADVYFKALIEADAAFSHNAV